MLKTTILGGLGDLSARRRQVIAGAIVACFATAAMTVPAAVAEELPRPTYANSLIVSIEHGPGDTTEVEIIKDRFNFGLYAWLSLSVTCLAPDLAWQSDWDEASAGIQAFKDQVDGLIQAAKARNVRLHIVVVSGLARLRYVYRPAKEEDIRNAQWFNDNKLCADGNIGNTEEALNDHIWGTLSRYARKTRANLEAKGEAMAAFLKQRMTEEPDTLVAVSGWGESELSYDRLNHSQLFQDYFCDYSPFAVMEFRDWIRHEGLYADSGPYAGQGWASGGARYQGDGGLANFNADFGTAFTTWDLKYYNWSLEDDYDEVPEDAINNDPHRIPFASYVHGAMMPTEGPDYIAGGFDPPRTMTPGNAFYDLFSLFRISMVRYYVRDMAKWASEAGIPADHWYSHQIPADYLYNTNPSMAPNLNPRYYSSASPLSTADIGAYGSPGATIYDNKFPDYFARTTLYGLPAIAALSSNWAIMEYDAETYPTGFVVTPSTPDVILDQFKRVYSYAPHLINFWRWLYDAEHNIKGTNKETALASFIDAVRDLGRSTDLAKVFDPPALSDISGSYVAPPGVIRLVFPEEIWDDLDWKWTDWGGFSRFEVFRGTEPGFSADVAHRIGTATSFTYDDATGVFGKAYFYRARAVNTKSVGGGLSNEIMVYPSAGAYPVLWLDKKDLDFGAIRNGVTTPAQTVTVRNLGPSGTSLSWSASANKTWIKLSPTTGTGEGLLSVSVAPAGLAVGSYEGKVTVSDTAAFNTPQTLTVYLKVYRSGRDKAPFGSFDTPSNGAVVSGSIPVSGWALDDIGVTKVEIRRDPVAGDPPAAIGPDGLIFVGDAVFVKGARPDVEVAWPAYPNADSAGWGYLLLTYGLPNQALTGDFNLSAVAFDATGHRTVLAKRTIHGDNAHRTKPFGTIDTPTQGGTASGATYTNFGWALTPLPKTIPFDGHTIGVYIDSVSVGHPTYNQFRQDVYDAFPGYNNSNGAVGFFHIDTTAYANGMHTISWGVADDAGAEDGIGSRYFWIQNFDTAATSALAPEAASPPLPLDTTGKLGVELLGPGDRAIQETGSVIVFLKGRGARKFVGWGADPSKPLPVGSTLNAKTGVFTWMPAPGFLGAHIVHFAVTDGRSVSKPVRVVINIRPKHYNRR